MHFADTFLSNGKKLNTTKGLTLIFVSLFLFLCFYWIRPEENETAFEEL